MISLKDIQEVYFIGIGGIGMSAIARYFNYQGVKVSGYDKTATPLTKQLEEEGIQVYFSEDIDRIPKMVDLVVYTPAIPATHAELQYYQNKGYAVKKRAEVLGIITKDAFTIAVAGSHGKTTVASMITHLLKHSGYDCTAFVGGIMSNYNANFVFGKNKVIVVEADEYDRSFLQLHPDIAIITAVDTDHLDIYQNKTAIEEAFRQFIYQIKDNGQLILKLNELSINRLQKYDIYTYHLNDIIANLHASNLHIKKHSYLYDLKTPKNIYENMCLNIGGQHNVENSIAAVSVALLLGIAPQKIKAALASFTGIKRRFEYIIQQENRLMIDDYAHHPREIDALLKSVKQLYPTKKITAIFQPHLYSRTRDLAIEFAESLSIADEVILLDIYPAREQPITGVTTALIYDKIVGAKKIWCRKEEVLTQLTNKDIEILLTIGAGDIDTLINPIKNYLLTKVMV